MNDDQLIVAMFFKLSHMVNQLAERDQMSSQIGNAIFRLFSDIKNEWSFIFVKELFELLYGDFRYVVFG